MLSPEVLTTETPLSAEERLELYRRKRWGMKLQDWWATTHNAEAIILDDLLLDLRDPPSSPPQAGRVNGLCPTEHPLYVGVDSLHAQCHNVPHNHHLRIVLEGGQFHRNLLLREVKGADFEITTHLLFEHTTNFQIAGLLIYQDDATMIKLGRAFCNIQNACVGNGIYFDSQQNARFAGANFATDTPLQDEAYLRITRRGNSFVGAYSEVGSTWMVIGRHESAMTDPKVGLVAGQSNVVGQVALFDFFTLVELP